MMVVILLSFWQGNSSGATLPKTNSSPLKMMVSNRNLLFQGSIFRGYVSFREAMLNFAGGIITLLFVISPVGGKTQLLRYYLLLSGC